MLDLFRPSSPFTLRARGVSFSPLSLFSASEPGVWLDPSDLTTLFQDAAGTTPVTAPGQSVALVLDKSQGLRIGAEQSANPGNPFTTTTGFTAATSTISLVAGRIKTFIPAATSGTAGIYWDTTVTANKAQKIVMDLEAEGRTFEVRIYNGASFATLLASDTISAGVRRNVSFTVTPTTSGVRVYILEGSGVDRSVYLASVSVRELPGNHATQATAASRPTYGIVPRTGRRNLLTYSEQFDNAAWVKASVTVSANAGTAPDGTMTADKVVATNTASTTRAAYQSFTAPSTAAYTVSFYAKAAEHSLFAVQEIGGGRFGASFNLSAQTTASLGGAAFVSSSITSVGNGWFRCSVVWNGVASTGYAITAIGYPAGASVAVAGTSYAGDGTSGILIWGAQLETGSTATAYQRVGSAFDVTEAGVPSRGYLSFDGVDDFLQTPTITPGIDKAQVFAGVRKLSDASIGTVVELTAAGDANNGGMYLRAPTSIGGANYQAASRGTINSATTATGFSAPVTNIVTFEGDITGDRSALRINQTAFAPSVADQGAGNYATAQMWIGRRGGTSLPFNGRIYGLIVRFGANLTADQITKTETWMNSKTGAF